MVPYNYDKQPTSPWSHLTSMQASIVLDQPGNVSFTNLDQISGKVVLRSGKSVDINGIIVKLEGESRTRLLSPPGPSGEKPKPQLEYHKVLYKSEMIFPRAGFLQSNSAVMSKSAYTIGPGKHEYPFMFKLPFNNSCSNEKGQMPSVSISGSGVEVAKAPTQHVKKTLPPTLSGFPGEAEIRYFVKATVKRQLFFKENPRAYMPFNFFPIEPPRPPVSGNEVYARQKHSFDKVPEGESTKSKMKEFFSRSKEPSSPSTNNGAPSISIDARLPEPAILTCNEDIPLRILVKKLNDCDALVYLQSLQISLIGSTKIRAHNVFRTENNSWVLMSKSNMGMPIGAVADATGTENVIPSTLWAGQSLPNTVAPSFETCNISRAYQLDVRIGISYTGAQSGSSKVRKGQTPRIPQSVILPVRLDVQVFSGIAPPRELLDAMAEARASVHRKSSVKMSDAEKATHLATLKEHYRRDSASSVPPTPIDPNALDDKNDLPAQQGTLQAEQPYTDAPPSYEDAVASGLPPVDGMRRPDYAPPAAAGEDDVLGGDEKRRFFQRRNS